MPQTTAYLLGAIFGLAATVLAAIFLVPESKKEKFKNSKFMLWLHDFLNFRTLIIEKILKFVYILATAFCICGGFFMLFSKGGFVTGLLTMIFGPIVVRITFELLMLAIIAVNNIIQINKKMPGTVSKEDESITD